MSPFNPLEVSTLSSNILEHLLPSTVIVNEEGILLWANSNLRSLLCVTNVEEFEEKYKTIFDIDICIQKNEDWIKQRDKIIESFDKDDKLTEYSSICRKYVDKSFITFPAKWKNCYDKENDLIIMQLEDYTEHEATLMRLSILNSFSNLVGERCLTLGPDFMILDCNDKVYDDFKVNINQYIHVSFESILDDNFCRPAEVIEEIRSRKVKEKQLFLSFHGEYHLVIDVRISHLVVHDCSIILLVWDSPNTEVDAKTLFKKQTLDFDALEDQFRLSKDIVGPPALTMLPSPYNNLSVNSSHPQSLVDVYESLLSVDNAVSKPHWHIENDIFAHPDFLHGFPTAQCIFDEDGALVMLYGGNLVMFEDIEYFQNVSQLNIMDIDFTFAEKDFIQQKNRFNILKEEIIASETNGLRFETLLRGDGGSTFVPVEAWMKVIYLHDNVFSFQQFEHGQGERLYACKYIDISKQKIAEEQALLASTILTDISLPIVALDISGRVMFANNVGLKLLESPNQIDMVQGQFISDLTTINIVPGTPEFLEHWIQSSMNAYGSPFIVGKDLVEMQLKVIQLETREMGILIGYDTNKIDDGNDVKLLKSVFESTVAPIMIVQNTGKIVDCNVACCELLQYTRDELSEKTIGEICVNEVNFENIWDLEAIEEIVKIQKGNQVMIQKMIQGKNEILECKLNIFKMLHKGLNFAIVTLENLSVFNLWKSKVSMYEKIIDELDDIGIAIYFNDGEILYVNRHFEEKVLTSATGKYVADVNYETIHKHAIQERLDTDSPITPINIYDVSDMPILVKTKYLPFNCNETFPFVEFIKDVSPLANMEVLDALVDKISYSFDLCYGHDQSASKQMATLARMNLLDVQFVLSTYFNLLNVNNFDNRVQTVLLSEFIDHLIILVRGLIKTELQLHIQLELKEMAVDVPVDDLIFVIRSLIRYMDWYLAEKDKPNELALILYFFDDLDDQEQIKVVVSGFDVNEDINRVLLNLKQPVNKVDNNIFWSLLDVSEESSLDVFSRTSLMLSNHVVMANSSFNGYIDTFLLENDSVQAFSFAFKATNAKSINLKQNCNLKLFVLTNSEEEEYIFTKNLLSSIEFFNYQVSVVNYDEFSYDTVDLNNIFVIYGEKNIEFLENQGVQPQQIFLIPINDYQPLISLVQLNEFCESILNADSLIMIPEMGINMETYESDIDSETDLKSADNEQRIHHVHVFDTQLEPESLIQAKYLTQKYIIPKNVMELPISKFAGESFSSGVQSQPSFLDSTLNNTAHDNVDYSETPMPLSVSAPEELNLGMVYPISTNQRFPIFPSLLPLAAKDKRVSIPSRILYVDNNLINLKNVKDLFEKNSPGFSCVVDILQKGEQVLDFCRTLPKERYDLFIIAENIGKQDSYLNAFNLVRQLNELYDVEDIPKVLICLDEKGIAQEDMDLFIGAIVKPLTKDTFASQIQTIVQSNDRSKRFPLALVSLSYLLNPNSNPTLPPKSEF
eukprot:TRINITY_DN3063_c0_g1_i1.p1 TRINITY_DN3063_c0_g1~~TRINITY_DN3063_c0_g1_i1.p1  ORF type:complete len:1491 (-),score=413.49 TRINITY_DN3063_c0_g1_i1:102-4538(-)